MLWESAIWKKWRQGQGVSYYIHQRKNIQYIGWNNISSTVAFRLIKMSSCAESAHLTASSIAPSQKEQWGWHPHLQIAFLLLHQSFDTVGWSIAHKTHRHTLSLTCATQISNYCTTIPLFTCVCDTFKTKIMIGEIEDTSPALYFCQAALVVPSSDITHAEPNLHQPTMRTIFGLHSWNTAHAKTFDPPNIVSSCAGPRQLCKHATVFTETPYAPWIILPH